MVHMVYRLVYRDTSDTLWVQYGVGNTRRRPHFLQSEHTSADNITLHPTMESALAGIERFKEVASSAVPKIQFAKNKKSEWTYVVDEESVLAHIDDMIAC